MSERKSRFRPAGSRSGDSEIETSGAEKVLAVVLAIFIAIGAIWGYFKLGEVDPVQSGAGYVQAQRLIEPAESAAIREHRVASVAVAKARAERRGAKGNLELRREAYRTALDASQPAGALRARYEAAQAGLASSSRELAAAVAAEARTAPAADAAGEVLSEARQAKQKRADDERAEHDRTVFLLRLALLLAMLAGAYRLLIRLRSRNSRYLLAALAWTGATAALAVVMAVDYTDGYLAFDEVGPLAISVAGAALTLVAFVALQRFLVKRVPARRARRGECAFCGYPLRDKPHCEGCGRPAIASCSTCHEDRRVGTPRCGYCGNA
jgi:hypothetical protein